MRKVVSKTIYDIIQIIFQNQLKQTEIDFLPEKMKVKDKVSTKDEQQIYDIGKQELLDRMSELNLENIEYNVDEINLPTTENNLKNIRMSNLGNNRTLYFRHHSEQPDDIFYTITKCIEPVQDKYILHQEKYIQENADDSTPENLVENISDIIKHITRIAMFYDISILLLNTFRKPPFLYINDLVKVTKKRPLVFLYGFINQDINRIQFEPIIHIDLDNLNELHFFISTPKIKKHFEDLVEETNRLYKSPILNQKIGDTIRSNPYDNFKEMPLVEIDSSTYGIRRFFLGEEIGGYRNIYSEEGRRLSGKIKELNKTQYNVYWCKNNNGLN